MGREKKALIIKERGDKVILTLDKTGWDPAHGLLLDTIRRCFDHKSTVADIVTQAIRLSAKEHFGEAAAERTLNNCRREVADHIKMGLDIYTGRRLEKKSRSTSKQASVSSENVTPEEPDDCLP